MAGTVMTLPPKSLVASIGVDGETVLRRHYVRARADEGVSDKFDDFVGAVAQRQVGGGDAEFLRQFCASDQKALPSGRRLQLGCRLAHGGDGARRRAERVLVEASLMMLAATQADFAGDFLNRRGPAYLPTGHPKQC